MCNMVLEHFYMYNDFVAMSSSNQEEIEKKKILTLNPFPLNELDKN